MHAGELIFVVVVNMPRKYKARNPVASPDKVWLAPRPAHISGPRAFEPAQIGRSNRYLEFADIALGVNETSPHMKKNNGTASQPGNQNRKSKVTSIDSHRPSNEGSASFRNPR